MPKFKTENVNTKEVKTGVDTGETFAAIEKGKDRKGQQPAAGEAEQEKRKRQAKTQGRKGCKMSRINMSVTPDNLEYIKIMSGVSGQSMSLFINSILDKHRAEHAEAYDAARAIINDIQN